jgi:hypothetical protein
MKKKNEKNKLKKILFLSNLKEAGETFPLLS